MKTKYYLAFIDILGYDKQAQDLAEETGFDVDFVRDKCILTPVVEIIQSFDDCKSYIFTDNFLIASSKFESLTKLIKELTSLRLPLKKEENISFEIAIGLEYLEPKIASVAQSNLISFLKNNLLENYKKFYKHSKGFSIKETFVVITKQIHDELQDKTRNLCNYIDFEGKNYFEIDYHVVISESEKFLEDIIVLNKYINKINEIGLWSHFEIKIFCLKNLKDQWVYKIIYINLLTENNFEVKEGYKTNHCLLLHQVFGIEELQSILKRLFVSKDYLETSNSDSFVDFTESFDFAICKFNEYGIESPAGDYKYTWPAYTLKMESSKLIDRDLEMIVSSELEQNYIQLKNNPTRLSDAVNSLFSPWSLSYSSFVLSLAPIQISKPIITFNSNRIRIDIPYFNKRINHQLFRLEIGGRIKGNPSRLLLTIENFNIDDKVIYSFFDFSDPILEDILRVRLYYKNDLFYDDEIKSTEY